MFSQIFQYVFIGVVQGIVEWLPISSQGNLVIILTNLFNIPVSLALDYSVYLHIGTVLAAIVYFRKELFSLFSYNNFKKIFFIKKTKTKNKTKTKTKDSEKTQELRFIVFAVVVTTIMFWILYPLYRNVSVLNIKSITLLIGILLIVTGVIQLFSKKIFIIKKNLSLRNSFFVGLFQGLSIFPGISRSGITTSALVFERFSPKDALKYSFLLSIPTIIIAELAYIILNGISAFNIFLLISILVSFIVGYFTIGFLLKIVEKINFAIFCFVLGLLYLIFFFI